jgi:very-short-patch-repair endonuclease
VQLQELDSFAIHHHGLITLQRTLHAGVGRDTWYRAIRARRIEQLYPGVARVWGSPDTLQQRALAAVWALGPGAMASHRTAAALWRVERPTGEPVDVLTTRRTRSARRDGVIVHRPRDLMDLRPVLRDRVPTTNPLRMLLDLGAVDPDGVHPAMIAVMSSKVASPAAVRAALFRHARQGRHGVTALRQSLQEWIGGELPPDSELESKMGQLVRRYRLPEVEFHAIAAGYEVDFLVVGSNVVLECDGWGTHGLDRDQFEFDRIRAAELTAAGYVIVRFTWTRLQRQPDAVATDIRRNLERWAPSTLPRGRRP